MLKKVFTIAEIEQWVDDLKDETYKGKSITGYFNNLGKTDEKVPLLEQVENNYDNIKEMLRTNYNKKNLAQQDKDVEKIKAYLDSLKELQHFIKPLLGSTDEAEKDTFFYGEFATFWDALEIIKPAL